MRFYFAIPYQSKIIYLYIHTYFWYTIVVTRVVKKKKKIETFEYSIDEIADV